jgi:hypothetical protein
MIKQRLSRLAPLRRRSGPRLVAVPPPEPGDAPRERLVAEVEGFRLTTERLEAGGRTYRLEELEGYQTRRVAPGLTLPLVAGGVAAMGMPVLLLRSESWPVTVALVLATAVLFASIAWLVVAADTYWLTVRTVEGEREVLRCRDHQLLGRVVEALGEALARRRLEEGGRRLEVVR